MGARADWTGDEAVPPGDGVIPTPFGFAPDLFGRAPSLFCLRPGLFGSVPTLFHRVPTLFCRRPDLFRDPPDLIGFRPGLIEVRPFSQSEEVTDDLFRPRDFLGRQRTRLVHEDRVVRDLLSQLRSLPSREPVRLLAHLGGAQSFELADTRAGDLDFLGGEEVEIGLAERRQPLVSPRAPAPAFHRRQDGRDSLGDRSALALQIALAGDGPADRVIRSKVRGEENLVELGRAAALLRPKGGCHKQDQLFELVVEGGY